MRKGRLPVAFDELVFWVLATVALGLALAVIGGISIR